MSRWIVGLLTAVMALAVPVACLAQAGGGMGGGGMGGGGTGGGGMGGGGGGMGGGGPMVGLGRMIFFDPNLSEPPGQSCASCHDPEVGFTGPDSAINAAGAVMEGAFHGRFGNRKPPSAAYATPSPVLRYDEEEGLFVGGIFWDGRAAGWDLEALAGQYGVSSPAAEQALGPFLNPLEQNLPGKATVILRICQGMYAQMFKNVWGAAMCDPANVDAAYERVGLSVAAFEASPMVNRYSSKFDRVLRGQAQFTADEQWGFDLFAADGKGQCAKCHVLEPADKPLFTDNTFDNVGAPRNPQNPFYSQDGIYNPDGQRFVDLGLGKFLKSLPKDHAYAGLAHENLGKHRVPTLRNVDKRPYEGFVKAYLHNGSFKTLEQVVHFYNTRDVLNDGKPCPKGFKGEIGVTCWPEPEVGVNLNRDELGDLGLTPDEEAAIVAFMKTLSDQ